MDSSAALPLSNRNTHGRPRQRHCTRTRQAVLLATAALLLTASSSSLFVQAGLRGGDAPDLVSSSAQLQQRVLGAGTAREDPQTIQAQRERLKRMNDERKRKNAAARGKKNDDKKGRQQGGRDKEESGRGSSIQQGGQRVSGNNSKKQDKKDALKDEMKEQSSGANKPDKKGDKLTMQEIKEQMKGDDGEDDELTKQEKKEQMKMEQQSSSGSSGGGGKKDEVVVDNGDKAKEQALYNQQNQQAQQQSSSTTNKPSFILKEEWESLSKQEKKDLLKLKDGDLVISDNLRPGSVDLDAVGDYDADESAGSVGTEVDDVKPSIQDSPQVKPPKDEPKEDDMSANDAFVSSSSSTSTSATNSDTSSSESFSFAEKLQDNSIQLDGFETPSKLKWNMSGQGWNLDTSTYYETKTSIKSGITSNTEGSETVNSDLALSTDASFVGGVLSFWIKADLELPNEAFYVSVDDEVALPPISPSDPQEWVEYSVAVESGQHEITWSHVYNPFGLESLPRRSGNKVGLWMDDLRLSPFDGSYNQGFEDSGELTMTTGGDATWEIDDASNGISGSYSIVASSKNIQSDSGSSNIEFVLNSKKGGSLKYNVLSSTTAPHDDFAIYLNGKPAEAIFGQSLSYEYKALDIPAGKVVVTMMHRKNPGGLSGSLLESLGIVETEGVTRLDDVRFLPI